MEADLLHLLNALGHKLDTIIQREVAVERRFLTIANAAEYCDLSPESIRRLIARGKLTALRTVSDRIVINRRELDATVIGSNASAAPRTWAATVVRQHFDLEGGRRMSNVSRRERTPCWPIFRCRPTAPKCCERACCLAIERGISICAPVHDALLIEAPATEIEEATVAMQQAMTEASERVLSGFQLRSNVELIVRYPDRYMDPKRGRRMWYTVMSVLDDPEAQTNV